MATKDPTPIFLSEQDKLRFLSMVDSGSPDQCWTWKGKSTPDGYGKFYVRLHGKEKLFRTHRVAFFIHNGGIPDGLHVLHKCDVPPCCNPNHLWAGTHAQNMADKVMKGRQFLSGAHPFHEHPERAPRGSDNGNSKLTYDDIVRIRERLAMGIGCTQLAKEFSVDRTNIYFIVKKMTWKHVP